MMTLWPALLLQMMPLRRAMPMDSIPLRMMISVTGPAPTGHVSGPAFSAPDAAAPPPAAEPATPVAPPQQLTDFGLTTIGIAAEPPQPKGPAFGAAVDDTLPDAPSTALPPLSPNEALRMAHHTHDLAQEAYAAAMMFSRFANTLSGYHFDESQRAVRSNASALAERPRFHAPPPPWGPVPKAKTPPPKDPPALQVQGGRFPKAWYCH